MDPSAVINRYLHTDPTDIRKLSGGHINETFSVTDPDGRYIFQSLKKQLYEGRLKALSEMYEGYLYAYSRVKDSFTGWKIPVWLKNTGGSYFLTDNDGNIWRAYEYLESDETDADIYEFGKGMGRLHTMLSHFPGKPVPLIPHFHDTGYFLDEYRKHLGSDCPHDKELEKLIDEKSKIMSTVVLPSGQIIHGDAKKSNALVNNGTVTAFIDIDTVYEGSRLIDIADGIRSYMGAGGYSYNELSAGFLEGYQSIAGDLLAKEETQLIGEALKLIFFELGLRYYTDCLSGNTYFREEKPGDNLARARQYLTM